MNLITNTILNFLVNQEVISDESESREFYKYGLEITISSILNILLVVALGLLVHNFINSILFLIIFIILRTFTGGFHASTYVKCNLLMCISFLSTNYISLRLAPVINTKIAIIISILLLISIILWAPIENINKPISQKRKIRLKIYSMMLYSLFTAISIIFINKNIKSGTIIIFTMIVVNILVLAAKIKELRNCK